MTLSPGLLRYMYMKYVQQLLGATDPKALGTSNPGCWGIQKHRYSERSCPAGKGVHGFSGQPCKRLGLYRRAAIDNIWPWHEWGNGEDRQPIENAAVHVTS